MSSATYYYPERMGRIILQAMEEIMGSEGVKSALHLASLDSLTGDFPAARTDRNFPFETVSRLQGALERAHGPRAGRGLALRIGRASFKYGLKAYGPMLGLMEMTFRLLPLRTKLRAGASVLAELFNEQTDQRVQIEERDGQIQWRIERCPVCWGRSAKDPVCHLAVGLLEESLYWLSGGRHFRVEETACIARGDPACTIVIHTTPIS